MNYSFAIAGALAFAALFQGIFAFLFARRLWTYRAPENRDGPTPRVAIVLSLRGADPDMEEGLRRLMSQDYPNYELRIAVDRETDPAWGVVQAAIRDTGFQHVRVEPFHERSGRCSLKNGAVVQLIRQLDDACEIVVLADGDLVAHRQWLHELVAPFRDPKVGATTGAIWCRPDVPTPGAMVRALFIASSEVAMFAFGIAWGGTVAIRTDVLRKTGLPDKWTKTLNEDQLVGPAMLREGLRLEFVPGLTMANREDCTLSFARNFIKRQMTSSRLYLPGYPGLLIHAFSTTGLLFFAAVWGIVGLVQGDMTMAACGLGGFFGYELVMIALHALMETGVRKVIGARGEPAPSYSWATWFRLFLAVPLTQTVYLAALVHSIVSNRIVWRGVVYRIRGPYEIEIEQDRPFEQSQAVRQSL